MVDQKAKELFEAFKREAGGSYANSLTREQKIALMKQCLQLEGFKPIEVFDEFYAQDLIIFGMQHKIPEAVRLGEKILGENG
jgi:hypothetical protein